MVNQDWEELQQKEHQLSDQQWTIEKEQRQVNHLKEAYQDHFRHSDQLFDEYSDVFRKTDFGHLFSELKNSLHQEKNGIFEQLEESNHELKSKHKKIDDELNELLYQRKKYDSLEEKVE